MKNQENHSFQILTGPIQLSTPMSGTKSKKFSLNFTTFLPDTDLSMAPIVNSGSNSHQTMIDQHIAKVCQHQSISKTTSQSNWHFYINMESQQHYPFLNTLVQFLRNANQTDDSDF